MRSKRNSKQIERSWSRMVVYWNINQLRMRLRNSKLVSCRMGMPSQRAKVRRRGTVGSLKAKGWVNSFLISLLMCLRLLRALQLLKIRKKKMTKSFLKINRTLKYSGKNAKMLKILNTSTRSMTVFCLHNAMCQKKIPTTVKTDLYLTRVWKIPNLSRSNSLVV